MQPSSPSDCQHLEQEQKYLGMDPQRGRYADVFLKVCPNCQAHWIHYYFEYEHLTGRGRWYEGRITSEQARGVTAATAAALLESLPSYQAGGSYFGGKVHSRSGPLLDTP
jgi:hypothetical protein